MTAPSLAFALEEFYKTSQLHPEQVYGRFEKRTAPVSLPSLPATRLSSELEYLYTHYECDAIFGSAGISITPFEKLARRQEGFATFSTDWGKTMQPSLSWNEQWTVFADVNDNPIVADTSTTGTPVYAAIEAVDYEMIAPSLSSFFSMLTQLLKATAALRQQQPTSDDIEDWIAFKTTTEIPLTLKMLGEIADSQYVQALGHFLYS